MIPTIETIIEGLLSGKYTEQQAVGWLYQHVTAAAVDAGRCLRDEFAAAALQGIMVWTDTICREGEDRRVANARIAYEYADAMISQRNK